MAGHGDPRAAAQPRDVVLHGHAVDLLDPLLADREREDLGGREREDVVVAQERLDRGVDGAAGRVGAGDLAAGQARPFSMFHTIASLSSARVRVHQRRERGEADGAQGVEHEVGGAQVRLGVHDLRTERGELGAARLEQRRDRGRHRQVAEVAAPRDAETLNPSGHDRIQGVPRRGDRLRVAAVTAGERAEQQRRVVDAASDRPEHRQRRPRVGLRVGGRDPAGGGAQPDDAAERRRVADARREVGPVGERQHPARHGHRRAAAAAARRQSRVVWVQRGAEHAVERVRAGRELGRVRLADDDRARPAQPLGEDAVRVRHVVGEDRRPVGGAHPGRVLDVLDRDRQPVQRARAHRRGRPPRRRPAPAPARPPRRA